MRAFSLVELSIVLVILGLLTGGILAGQSLIRASELRSLSTDITRYQAAIFTFRDKYMGWPGDFSKAVSFWGNATDGTTVGNCTNDNDIGTGTQTCNGNGNGWIGLSGVDNKNLEAFRAWQHLVNAGLIEGSYTGAGSGAVAGATGWRNAVRGSNVPAVKFDNACISFAAHALSDNGSGSGWTAGSNANVNRNYAMVGTVSNLCWGSFLKVEEAWNLDSKLDDTKPGLGKFNLQTGSVSGTGCATSGNTDTAEYNLSNTTSRCALDIVMAP